MAFPAASTPGLTGLTGAALTLDRRGSGCGLVAWSPPASVTRGPDGVSFVLTDGVHEVRVMTSEQPRGVFTEGQGVLVEGVLDVDGVFRSDLLLVKHGND